MADLMIFSRVCLLQTAKRMGLLCVGVTLIASLCAPVISQIKPEESGKSDEKKVELSEKELAFQELLTNAKLRGKFTIPGKDDGNKLTEEEYTIIRVSKTSEKDLWVFMARVKYGKNDYTVPLTLNVQWADDTPMITLTDLTIMGQGPFSARVLFYDKKYAGTWSHGEVGGHLFGTIEKADSNESVQPTENKAGNDKSGKDKPDNVK
jgi:hypothetical protein